MGILQKVFHTVTTTEDIAAEFGKELPGWVAIKSVTNKEYQLLLQLEVDNGKQAPLRCL